MEIWTKGQEMMLKEWKHGDSKQKQGGISLGLAWLGLVFR